MGLADLIADFLERSRRTMPGANGDLQGVLPGALSPARPGLANPVNQAMPGFGSMQPIGAMPQSANAPLQTAVLDQLGLGIAADRRPASAIWGLPRPLGAEGVGIGPARFQMAAYQRPNVPDQRRGVSAAADYAGPAAARIKSSTADSAARTARRRRQSAAPVQPSALPRTAQGRSDYADVLADQIATVTGDRTQRPLQRAIAREMQIAQLSPADKLNAVRAGQIYQAAQAAGGDPLDAVVTANVESQLRPEVQSGLYQNKFPTWSQLGGDPDKEHDLNAQVIMYATKTSPERRERARKVLGREPEGWETYVAHQQGDSGAAALFRAANTAPDAPASTVLAPAKRKQGESLQHAQERTRQELQDNRLGRDATVAQVLGALKDLYERRRKEALNYLQISGVLDQDAAMRPTN